MSDRASTLPPVNPDPATTRDARGNAAARNLGRHGIQPPYNPATLPTAVLEELREVAAALGVDRKGAST